MKYIDNLDSFVSKISDKNACPKEDLVTLSLDIIDTKGVIRKGELIVHKDIEQDITEIFSELLKIKYPVENMQPISAYNNNDDVSMIENNTYSYCHRYIRFTHRLSPHSFGICIDLNPRYNPCVRFNNDDSIKSVFPKNGEKYANRDVDSPYKITDEVVEIFKKHGFSWGGDWNDKKDYHHFERTDLRNKYIKERE